MMESYFQDSKILIFFKKLSALRLFLVVVAVIIISLTAVINNTQAQEATSSSQNTSTTTTEAPPTPQDAAQTTSFFDCIKNPTACTISSFVGIFNTIATKSIEIFRYLLTSFSAQSVTPQAIYIIWKLFNSFISMFFILLFVIMAYSQIFQVKTFLPQNIIGPLILIAILLNFTYIIPVNVIAVGDQLTSAFVKPIQGSLEGTLSGSVLFAETIARGSGALDIITRGFISIVFAVVIAVIFFILSAALVVRLIISWVLIISAPFVFFAYIIPAGRSAFDRWSSELTSWAFFPAIYAFCLYFGVTILQQKQNFGTLGSTQFLGLTIADVIFLIFALVILLGSLVFAKTLGGFLGLKTAKSFAAFEGAIGLSDITSAIEKRDIKGLGAGLIKPFQAVGDNTLGRIPGVKPYYQGFKQGIAQRTTNVQQRIQTRIQSGLGRFSAQQGQVTQERIAAFVGGSRGPAAKGTTTAKIVKDERTRIEEELSRMPGEERNAKLESYLRSGNKATKDAATLIKIDNDVANGKKYDTEEYINLIKQFGGEKTEQGKTVFGKIKDNLVIPGTLSKKEEDSIRADTTLTEEEKQAKIESRKKEEAAKKQKIALGEDPATKDLKEYRKEIFKNLVKRGVIQGENSEEKINNIKNGLDQLIDPTEQSKLIRDIKLSDIFKDDDLLISFAQSDVDQNDLFKKTLQDKAIMDVIKKGKVPSNFISSQDIDKVVDKVNGSLNPIDQNKLINISNKSTEERVRIIDEINLSVTDPEIKSDLEKLKSSVTSASDKIEFYNKLISGLRSDEDKKDFKAKINASDIFKERGDFNDKNFKNALSNFDDDFIGKAIKYAKDNPRVLDEEGKGYEKAVSYLKDTEQSDFIRKIEERNPLVTGRYNTAEKIVTLLEGASTDFYKNKDLSFYDNLEVKKYIYKGISNNKFNAEQKKELNKSKGAKYILRLHESIRKTEEAIRDPAQTRDRVKNSQKLARLTAELGFNPT